MSKVILERLIKFIEAPERYTVGSKITEVIWEGVETAVNETVHDAVHYAVKCFDKSTVKYVKDIVG